MLVTYFRKIAKIMSRESYIEDLVGTPLDPRTEEERRQGDTDSYLAMVRRLEPTKQIDKDIYYGIIIGDDTTLNVAEGLGVGVITVLRRKKKIIKDLKEKLKMEIKQK